MSLRQHTRLALHSALVVCAGALALGCGGGSSGGGGGAATAAPVASGATGATTSGTTNQGPAGPLAQKALDFEALMGAQHLGLGQVQNVRIDPATGAVIRQGNAPSRCLWTGVYTGTQALRYRATGDLAALRRLEEGLWTLHNLHAITGLPGVIARGYDEPSIETNGWPASGAFSQYNHNKGETSRDQYAGWFYGVALAWDECQDPQLKALIEADVRAVCDKLMANNLHMETPWGPNGTVESFFNLRPDNFYQDQINAQTWATVDDFPFNILAKSIPYSQQLADAIKNAQVPPIRAGEALRAIFFFTVAEHITGDSRYVDYKNQLLHVRGYLQVLEDYMTILDDLFYGRNMQVVEDTLRQLFVAITDIITAYLQSSGTFGVVAGTLLPLVSNSISGWLADVLTDALAWLHDPNNSSKIQNFLGHGRIAVLVLSVIGQNQLAQQANQFLSAYGPHLSHQGLIDFGRTVRSHLGANLTVLPLSAMMRLEPDQAVVNRYEVMLDNYWSYLSTDHNPIVNLVHAGYGLQPGPDDVPHTVEALRKFPTDLRLREVDNSNYPGLVVSPWPDRFGRVGRIALYPDYFPIDQRAPDIFPWRGHPRQIKSGSNNPDVHVAPLGYLAPYWMARELGFLTHQD